jgi:hypothetical protein
MTGWLPPPGPTTKREVTLRWHVPARFELRSEALRNGVGAVGSAGQCSGWGAADRFWQLGYRCELAFEHLVSPGEY